MHMNFLTALLSSVIVQTAPLEEIYSDSPVVTNVIAAADMTTNDVRAISGDVTSNVVTKAYVDALHIDGLLTDADKKKLGAIAINGTAQGNIPSASSLGNYSTAVGASASASGNYSTAMGYSAFATNSAVAFGRGASASDSYATAFGYQAAASANSAMALGRGANATAGGAVQIGLGTNTKANTLQFKDYTLLESSGKIPFDRLNVGTTSNTVASGDSVLNAIATAEAYTDALVNETNETFAAAVAAVSPPVVLPQKWALANVTNAQGGAVTAADVGAVARDANYLSVSNSALSALQPAALTNYYTKAQVDSSLSGKANDNAVVKLTGDQEIGGNKIFTGLVTILEEEPNYAWNKIYASGFEIGGDGISPQFVNLPSASGTLALLSNIPNISGKADKADLAAAAQSATNYTDTAISEIAIPTKAEDIGAYPAASGNALAATVNAWEGYWDGTNVIFEVTNYYGNTSGDIPTLRIKEFRSGAWNTVWDEANKFTICETNIMSNVVGFVSAEVNGMYDYCATNYAPLAWGSVTDKGTPNPVSNTVWMTAPETYFAGGTEYQRVAVGSGAICVLVDNGALAHTAGEPGTFRFQDDGGTNYFGFAKSDSYTIGCRTDGITVEGTLVTLRYDVIMSGNDTPIVYYRQSLESGSWEQLNYSDGTSVEGASYPVTWYMSGGSHYAAINCGDRPSGFFRAETAVAGEVKFTTNMKIDATSGIVCPNTATGVNGVIRPTFNGSTVIWNWSAN